MGKAPAFPFLLNFWLFYYLGKYLYLSFKSNSMAVLIVVTNLMITNAIFRTLANTKKQFPRDSFVPKSKLK